MSCVGVVVDMVRTLGGVRHRCVVQRLFFLLGVSRNKIVCVIQHWIDGQFVLFGVDGTGGVDGMDGIGILGCGKRNLMRVR